ncbi:3-isopropylmalate dehydratase small subunit [Gottschalkiaceae bacterium SANA]|nr:3-isopropylmalate dehydratase small subunit [Gottschalkiaceae bacterium SANA]
MNQAFCYGDHIDTDVIIPARFLDTSDAKVLGGYCMMDLDPDFVNQVSQGDLIVAGENFGCGSSREHAPLAILGAGVSCVIAKSFARIFFRNAINVGLPIVACPEAVEGIENGDTITVDLAAGIIKNETKNARWQMPPYPQFLQELIAMGGLENYVKKQKEGQNV